MKKKSILYLLLIPLLLLLPLEIRANHAPPQLKIIVKGVNKDILENIQIFLMNEEKKLELCDFIIINDEQQMVIPQVLGLHQQLLRLSLESLGV